MVIPPAQPTRRDALYIGTALVGCVGGLAALTPFVMQLAPDADTVAKREIGEVDLSSIAEGQAIKVSWRSIPILIRHRTQDEIAAARAADLSTLRDPQADHERVGKGHPQWLVLIAVCTYERCILGVEGGLDAALTCPCCASAYDGAGRVTRGPAPRNLEVPPYAVTSERRLRIG